ncbi:MAG: hypothetical protein CO108_29420 [Deltaproteobacteria bacterium CG_4_9_14_3_um_filter_63_12]|nr:MAG: hypothetical protein COW42_12040 [Deltaproteobacteria bacterium CG17_big_fil_post_rev_8_21_14_2_50_63_7]PJB34036.1 MAG: hypothetical protein CO108_29420 [Deltaproteobacteria bacterium CG_4_9_14_3_um_filter_63_12]
MNALRTLLTLALLAPTPLLAAELPTCDFRLNPAERELWVLTMSPGAELFTVFGHNGLYLRDPRADIDEVYNFGAYETNDPNLLEGFLAGTQLYTSDTRSFHSMLAMYSHEERTVVAQKLDLPPAAAQRLVDALRVAIDPEHADYRYHWALANCSTKVRDLIAAALEGPFVSTTPNPEFTQRGEVLRHMASLPWVELGVDFIMAKGADEPLSEWDATFLPANLRDAMAKATFEGRPIVSTTCLVYRGRFDDAPAHAPERTATLWALGLSLGVLILLLAFWPNVATRALLAAILATYGLVGGALSAVSLWLWAGSKLEVFWQNSKLFFVNPGAVGLFVLATGVLFGSRWATKWARLWALGLLGVACAGLLVTTFGVQERFAFFGLFAPPLLAFVKALPSFSKAKG